MKCIGPASSPVISLLIGFWLSATFGSSLLGQTLSGWSDVASLPNAVGLGGPQVGVHNDALIVVGGANFPNGKPWDENPGTKVYHSQIYVLRNSAGDWITPGRLPICLAYAVAIRCDEGLILFGGETVDGDLDEDGAVATSDSLAASPTSSVWLVSWNKKTETLSTRQLADLPMPMAYHAGGKIGDRIYLAHSRRGGAEGLFDEKHFISVDVNKLLASEPKSATDETGDASSNGNQASSSDTLWTTHDAWPGAPRHKAVGVVQKLGNGQEQFFLISGENPYQSAPGTIDLSKLEYHVDGYRFDPRNDQWQAIAKLPAVTDARPQAAASNHSKRKPVAAGSAAPLGPSDILVFSGSTGRFIALPSNEIPAFPTDVLNYNTITDTWRLLGQMPEGVVTTGAVAWPDRSKFPVQDRIVIPSGEVKPAVRTARVQLWTVQPPERRLGWINIAVIAIYLAGLVALGFYFSRREKGTDDFFLAGRRIPWWAAGLSIYATQLSAITFVSIPATAYSQNWLTFVGQCAIPVMLPLFVFCYLPFYRKLNLTTVYEYLERRFHRIVRWYGSLSFVGFQMARMAMVVYLPAIALSAVTGWNVVHCILAMGVLSTLYTVLGGIEAVIWTDVIQVLVLWGGILVAGFLAVQGAGGWAATEAVAVDYDKWKWFLSSSDPAVMSTWAIFIGSCFLQFGPYTTDQAVVQRYLTTKTQRDAARGMWLNGFLAIPFSIVFFLVGTTLFAYFHAHPAELDVGMQNDRVLPLFVVQQLPVGLSGLVIAGIFAASMSTLDSSMHSIATTLSNDFARLFFPKARPVTHLRVARLLTLAAGVAGTASAIVLASLDIQSVFLLFQKSLGLVSSALAGVFILGIFTRRGSAVGAMAGAASCVAALWIMESQTNWHFYWHSIVGILTCVSVGMLVSCVLPANPEQSSGLCWWSRDALPEAPEESG